MSVFLNITPKYLAELIHSARARVVYAAAGVDDVVASALINVAKKVGLDNVLVVLDVAENVLRFGYGNIDGITLLQEEGITIKKSDGLRIGALIYDDKGLIFSSTPLLIEAGKSGKSEVTGEPHANAIHMTDDQAENIVTALVHQKTSDNSADTEPEIGIKYADAREINEIIEEIDKNPPQSFDLSRQVQIFGTIIEFVEIKLTGCEIQRHTVSIPTELIAGEVDSQMKKQLTTGYKIIEKSSDLSGDTIRLEVNQLRKSYTKKIGMYGSVLLKSKKSEFEKDVDKIRGEIKAFQESLEKKLSKEIEESRCRLSDLLTPNVQRNPPSDLSGQIIEKTPTFDQAKQYVEKKLKEIFPSADAVIEKMSLEYIMKGVTHELLLKKEFHDKVMTAYPLIRWEDMLDEYTAARGQ